MPIHCSFLSAPPSRKLRRIEFVFWILCKYELVVSNHAVHCQLTPAPSWRCKGSLDLIAEPDRASSCLCRCSGSGRHSDHLDLVSCNACKQTIMACRFAAHLGHCRGLSNAPSPAPSHTSAMPAFSGGRASSAVGNLSWHSRLGTL